MKIIEIIAFVFGSFVFFIGVGLFIFSVIISYNTKQLEILKIATGLALSVAGWLITKYVAKSSGRTVSDMLYLFFPS